MATIYDVAKKAGVSLSTASNVLSNKKYVSEELRKKVFDVCEKLNYRPNFIASSLAGEKTGIIGIFFESFRNEFGGIYMPLIKGIGMAVSEKNYSPLLILNVLNRTDYSKHRFLKSGLLEGAIVLAPIDDDFRIKELKTDNVPTVIIGTPPKGIGKGLSFIDADNEQSTYCFTKHLIENGHKKIVFLNGILSLTICQDRLRGFKKAFYESGIKPDEKLIFSIDLNETSVINALNKAQEASGFSACLCESSATAQRCYAYAREKGLVIGKNLAVISLGGEAGDMFNPSLTTMFVDYEEAGKSAARLLFDSIANSSAEPKFEKSSSTIIYGDSSNFKFKE